MGKKLLVILLAVCLAPAVMTAQNPRAVIKAIYKGDSMEQIKDKHDRAVKSNPGNEPQMQLMEAMYLYHTGFPVDGYYQYCAGRDEIESSPDIAKMLKSLQLRLPDLFSSLESASTSEILRLDDEEQYDRYIKVAAANGNQSLDILLTARENKAFSNAEKKNSIQAYTAFLEKYPDASDYNRDRALSLRTALYYIEAAASGNEQQIEKFLSDYPDYSENDELAAYLSDLRYERIMKNKDLEELKWFAEEYPGHKYISTVRRTISDIEYRNLDVSDLEAVEAYLASWPDAEHSADLRRHLEFESMLRSADLASIFAYIENNGYTAEYPRMVRAIARTHDALILTPDIREVDLVRFRDGKGKVGYWNKNGTVVIPARYDTYPAAGGSFPFDAVYGPEFVRDRGIAAVRRDVTVGVINGQGTQLLDFKGGDVDISDVISIMLPSDTDTVRTELYTLTGSHLGSGEYVPASAICARRGEFNRGAVVGGSTGMLNARANVSLGPEDMLSVLTRDGIALGLKAVVKNGRIRAYNDHFIATDKGIVNVDNWSVMGRDTYEYNEFMKEGMILVGTGGKWGYLDAGMRMAIEPGYSYAESFSGGSALVSKDGGWSLIDVKGRIIFSSTYMRRLHFGDPGRSEFEHYSLYVYRDADAYGVVDSGAKVILQPVELDVDADGVPAIGISDDGDLEFIRNGRTHRFDITELVSNTTE